MILKIAFTILLCTSTLTGNVNSGQLKKSLILKNENIESSTIENRLTASKSIILNNEDSFTNKLHHKISLNRTPIHIIPQKSQSKDHRREIIPILIKSNNSSMLSHINTTPRTIGTTINNAIYQSTKSTPRRISRTINNAIYQSTKSTPKKWKFFCGPLNNTANQTVTKGESNSIEKRNGQVDLMPSSIIDTENLMVTKSPQFVDDNSSKSLINNGPHLSKKESLLQMEHKIEDLEEKLKSQGEIENSSLLFALSLLHQHISSTPITQHSYFPKTTSNPTYVKDVPKKNEKHKHKTSRRILWRVNRTIWPGNIMPFLQYTNTISLKDPHIETSTPSNNSPRRALYRSLILILDGNCIQIRNRINTFVKFLKGTLATKLNVEYTDIRVPSVVCDKSFIINVSFNEHDYPDAYSYLKGLAGENATLLEISGQIFYLEMVLTALPTKQFGLQNYFGEDYGLQIVVFISAICMCIFATIVVAIFYLIKCYYCRVSKQPSQMPDYTLDEKPPNIIYSSNFATLLNFPSSTNSQERNSNRSDIKNGGSSHVSREVYPITIPNDNIHLFKSLNENNQTFSNSSSQLKLMEEIDEDEEHLYDELNSNEKSEC